MSRWNDNKGSERGRWHQKRNNTVQTGKSALDKAYETFASMMISKIESVKNDWKKPWFTAGTLNYPQSMYGKSYNGSNAIMLMLVSEKEGYNIPVFGTFERIMSLNFAEDKKGKKGKRDVVTDAEGNPLPRVKINTGAHSFPIILPTFTVVNKENHEKIKYSDFRELSEQEQCDYNVYRNLKVYNVFNIDQTNLREARPELYQKYAALYETPKEERSTSEMFSLPAVDKLIEDNMFICPIKPTYGDDAYFSISKNEIVIPEKQQFRDGESFYSNLFHEMAHATGMEEITGRLKPASFGSEDYAREELVAELTSALISVTHGIDKHLKDDSAAYIKSWLDSLNKNPEFIKTVLTDVRSAATVINSTIEIAELQLNKDNPNALHYSDEEAELEDNLDDEDRRLSGVDFDGDGEVEYSESHEEKEKKFASKR